MPWAWLGPIAVATWLYKNRRDLRKVIVFGSAAVLTVVWAGLLWASPSLRFAVGLALPSGLATAGLMWLASEYPQLPPFLALQCAIAERRQREVLSDAVPASAGEGARVVAVRPLGGDEFEAAPRCESGAIGFQQDLDCSSSGRWEWELGVDVEGL